MNNDTIQLIVPKKADYISLIRLTSSAIASKLGFNIEDLEDIKVLVGESCILTLSSENTNKLDIEFKVVDDVLEILIKLDGELDIDEINESEKKLSKMIIESLADEVEYSKNSIRLIKSII